MGSANIQAKIKRGLAKAVSKTGSSNIDLVYLINKTNTGGNTPINTPVITESKTLLVDAVFQSLDAKLFDGDIKASDRQMVSNNNVEIKQGDIIEQGTQRYFVNALSIKAPTSDVLAYISQLRLQ